MLIPKENKKLQQLIDKHSFGSQNAFAEMIGVTQTNINRLFRVDERNGEVPNVLKSKSVLKAIKNKFDFADIEWFSKETEIVDENLEDEAPNSIENKNGNTFIELPNGQYLMIMPLAEFNIQAGFLDNYTDVEFLAEISQHSIIVDKPVKGRYIAFRVKGDSMDDGSSDAILQNSIVSTRELQRHLWESNKLHLKDFQYWVIYTSQSKYPLLKQIISHNVDKGMIKCHSLNDGPEYKDFELRISDIQALFYVVDVSRSISKKINY